MTPNEIKKLEKFLLYVLARRPDEFGLLPDPHGFVKVKRLLQALHEEPGWKHVRQAHINSVLLMNHPCALELNDNGIRACKRDRLPRVEIPEKLPKLLYTAIRRRAQRSAYDKGIYPGTRGRIQLSSESRMAERLGRRTDNDPVLLTVHTTKAIDAGTSFRKFGDALYLADFLLPEVFNGPPLPKEQPEKATPRQKASPQRSETPGSYFPDIPSLEDKQAQKQTQRRGEKKWKKQRRMARKEKERQRH